MNTDTVPPSGQGSRQHTDALDQFFQACRNFGVIRPRSGRWFAGVSAGLAARFGLDPLIVRAGFILGACLFGAAVPVYLIAWMLLPDEDGRIMVERALREGHGPSVALSIVLTIVIINGVWVFGSWGSWGLGLGSLIVIGLLLWAIGSGHLRVSGGPDGDDLGDRLRRGWDATGWGQTPGNRAAETGAAHRTADGHVDLAKHDTGTVPPGATPSGIRPVPPRPPKPPRRPRLGAIGLLILGAAAVAGAGTAMALDGTTHGDDAVQLGLAVATGVIGLGLLIGGLIGARGGFLTVIGIPVAVAAVVALLVPSGMSWSGGTGERVWVPSSVAAGQRHTFEVVAGDGTLDLGRLDPTAVHGQNLTARVNVGSLKILVPANLTVRITARVDAGTVHLPPAALAQTGDGSNPSGTGIKRTFTIGSGPADLTIDARVGVGDLTVESR